MAKAKQVKKQPVKADRARRGEGTPRERIKRRYGEAREEIVVPVRLRSKRKHPRPWADVPHVQRMQWREEVVALVDRKRKELGSKPPTGEEYAGILRLRFQTGIAARTARELFAHRAGIVLRWRDCVAAAHSRATARYRLWCELNGVAPGSLPGHDFPICGW